MVVLSPPKSSVTSYQIALTNLQETTIFSILSDLFACVYNFVLCPSDEVCPNQKKVLSMSKTWNGNHRGLRCPLNVR